MTLAFMLDTDSVSYALRGRGDVGARILAQQPSELCVSAITVAELRFGADKRRAKRLHGLIDAFVRNVEIKPFDDVAAVEFGKLAAKLSAKGSPIGDFDTLIASHALALELTLVTNNAKHFGRVPGLRIESWA